MQLLAMAICQIETTGIEPVSHDIQYHCSTTELCFISPPITDSSFQRSWDEFHVLFHSTVIQLYLSELIVFSIASIGLYPRFCKICLKTVTD